LRARNIEQSLCQTKKPEVTEGCTERTGGSGYSDANLYQALPSGLVQFSAQGRYVQRFNFESIDSFVTQKMHGSRNKEILFYMRLDMPEDMG
jgi:hypothetical protein